MRRHTSLKSFLVNVLSVSEPVADEAACKMEHAITGEVLERFLSFAKFVEACPRAGADWIEDFDRYCESGTNAGMCVKCLSDLLEKLKEKQRTCASAASSAIESNGCELPSQNAQP